MTKDVARQLALAAINEAGRRLSPRALAILAKMWDDEDSLDGELVQEGREVWLGYERSSPQIVYALLRACAIKDVSDSSNDVVRRYVINETGRKLLERVEAAPASARAPKEAPDA